MGRSSNRKWTKRIRAWLTESVAKRLEMRRLFGRHRKFKVSR